MGFPGGTSGKESASQCKRHKRPGFDIWVRKIPWRRTWQPTPMFLPGRIPQIENPDGPQSVGSQSWIRLKRLSVHKYTWRSKILRASQHGQKKNKVFQKGDRCYKGQCRDQRELRPRLGWNLPPDGPQATSSQDWVKDGRPSPAGW